MGSISESTSTTLIISVANPEPHASTYQKRFSYTHMLWEVLFDTPYLSYLTRQVLKIYKMCKIFFFGKSIEELEITAKKHLSARMFGMLQNAKEEINYYKALKGLTSALNWGERAILETVEKFSQEQFVEFLKGAYIRFDDTGTLYAKWFALPKKKRMSSHSSDSQQYAIRGNFFKENLISIKVETIDGHQKSYTWMQLESEPVSITRALPHMLSYVRYRFSGLNQGPYGQSVHTDRNPLLIKNPFIPDVPDKVMVVKNPKNPQARDQLTVPDWHHFDFSNPTEIKSTPLPTSKRQQKKVHWHKINDERNLFAHTESSQLDMRLCSEVEKENNAGRQQSGEGNHDKEPLQREIQGIVTNVANGTSHVGGQTQ